MKTWKASLAKARLPEIIDAAVTGEPQLIERRDGKEVVVVSKDHFERTRPNLKTVLLENTYAGEGEDEFDQILLDIRSEGFDLLSRTPKPPAQ
jgi:prevent-host-death family protein